MAASPRPPARMNCRPYTVARCAPRSRALSPAAVHWQSPSRIQFERLTTHYATPKYTRFIRVTSSIFESAHRRARRSLRNSHDRPQFLRVSQRVSSTATIPRTAACSTHPFSSTCTPGQLVLKDVFLPDWLSTLCSTFSAATSAKLSPELAHQTACFQVFLYSRNKITHSAPTSTKSLRAVRSVLIRNRILLYGLSLFIRIK